jgi:hydroxymethylglutaryl-CoA lyase
MTLPRSIHVLEVGPRDGLQNEGTAVPTADKIAFIEALVDAGCRDIEVTSFVRPDTVPQLADAEAVMAGLPRAGGVTYSALVPNEVGLRRAIDAGLTRIAVFTAASESFAQRNIRMSIKRSLAVFARVVEQARAAGVTVRGYISTCFVCPYEGEIDPARVVEIGSELIAMGVDHLGISDTIGAAVPTDVQRTIGLLLESIEVDCIALHLHDTYGTALANALAGMQMGVRIFDASAGGLGGCPYAPGAAGNLATEDLLYMLDRMGIATGIDLMKLYAASRRLAGVLGRELPGRQYRRLRSLGA